MVGNTLASSFGGQIQMQGSGPPSIDEILVGATEHHKCGRLVEAERGYAAIIAREPGHFVSLHRLALLCLQQGRLGEALHLVEAALRVDADAEVALLNKGAILLALKRPEQALTVFTRVVMLNPTAADAHFNIGNALMAMNHPADAAASFARVLSLRPGDVEARRRYIDALTKTGRWAEVIEHLDGLLVANPMVIELHHERAGALIQCQRYEEAIAAYDHVLALKADDTVALNNRGTMLLRLNRPRDALTSIERGIALKPQDPDLWYNHARILVELRQFDSALLSYDRVLAVNPDHVRSLVDRGNVLRLQGRTGEALTCYERAVRIMPDDVAAHTNMGNVLQDLRDFDRALAAHERALAIQPKSVEALINRGRILKHLNRTTEAVASYEQALAIDPHHPEALYNCGLALAILGRHEEAFTCHQRALRSLPEHRHALGALADAALHTCNWRACESLGEQIEKHIRESRSTIIPFTLLGYSEDPALQLQCSKAFIAERFPRAVPTFARNTANAHKKLRIAYLSADFHRHATAFLTAELFERHDRNRFDVLGISWGPDDASATRGRLKKAFDTFIDVASVSDTDVAKHLHALGVAIAIDLKGLTGDNRLGIFAHRPAPLQVAYLGYPATVGSACLDYVLADAIVLPFDQQEHWTERIVHLPFCYQANDRERPVPLPQPTVTRSTLGLPPSGFVYCCFNNVWKITPAIFDVWMRLLRTTPGSVLWLVDDNSTATHNLRREAEARGVNPERLVFAARVEPELHLARHHFADLFLDTLPCNAHTTASDALWTGLPIVTCLGRSFAGRVAASLLHAIGLRELICRGLDDYETAARRIATDPDTLRTIKMRLQRNRLTTPLFDSEQLCRDIETAYLKMWEIHQFGQEPHSFAVE